MVQEVGLASAATIAARGRDRTVDHYGVDYRALWINLYRDNRDPTGRHGDVIRKVQRRHPPLPDQAHRGRQVPVVAGGIR
jgi:hypothetical protein